MRIRVVCFRRPLWVCRDGVPKGFVGDYGDAYDLAREAYDEVGVDLGPEWCYGASENDSIADFMGREPGDG